MGNKFCSDLEYADLDAVQAEYPSADEIIEVDGGWMVFDTTTDADTWRRQA